MILIRYVCRKFFAVFFAALGFFSMVLCLVDLFLNLWRFLVEAVPLVQIAQIVLLYVPKAMSFSLPLSVLFGAAYVLSDLYAKNELLAIFASGVSLIRFTLPLLIISVLLSIGSFFFEDAVVVPTFHRKTELQSEALKEKKPKNSDNVVVISESGKVIYKAAHYNDASKMLYNVYIVCREDGHNVSSIIRADYAQWKDGAWHLNNYTNYVVRDGSVSVEKRLTNVPPLTELPESFQNVIISVEEVNVKDARVYINYLKRAGLPYSEALSVYYKKFSFPFILVIVVFLSIGLSGKTRKNVLLVSLLLCVGAAVVYYILQMITMLLAQFDYISPIAGAWAPVLLYVALSCVLIRFART